MEEIVKTLLQSPLLYIITLIIFILLIVTGKLRIHTGTISIGNESEKERRILRTQLEYASAFCKGLLRKFPEDENKYRSLYIIEQIYNVVSQTISFNHLTLSSEYIQTKQEVIWNVASVVEDNKIYQTDEFKDFIFEKTDRLIRDLYNIRKTIEKNY